MSARRVLITGAAGFVGAALTTGFVDFGWDVLALDRAFDAPNTEGVIRSVHRLRADLAGGVPAHVPAVDLVIHAAWVTTDPETLGITPADHVALNLRPLLAVLDYACRTRPAAFVFLSSSGVFAPEDATEGLTDAHEPSGASPYAAAKRAGELLVPAALGQGTAVHVVRLGYLFGPGEVARATRARLSLVARWLAAARAGEALDVRSDDPARDWTFTPDLAAALARVVDAPPAGHAIHLGSSHVYRDSELAKLIAAQVPGTRVVRVSAGGRVKPPMVASSIPALRGFTWTDPHAGVRSLLAHEVAT